MATHIKIQKTRPRMVRGFVIEKGTSISFHPSGGKQVIVEHLMDGRWQITKTSAEP